MPIKKMHDLKKKPSEPQQHTTRHKLVLWIGGLATLVVVAFWLWVIWTVTGHYTPPPWASILNL